MVGVSYSSDIGMARQRILNIVAESSLARKEPAPAVQFKSFGDSAINLAVEFWVDRERLFEAQNMMADAIKRGLEESGIEMPFPQRTLGFLPNQTLRVEVLK
jgi:small conductance mechanosensitive channel